MVKYTILQGIAIVVGTGFLLGIISLKLNKGNRDIQEIVDAI
tara:strand:- start:93 stop:218 length:126 start_codon:yes stop_codon:yes gene_type:complete